jgi:hypothetical protein
MGTGNNRLGSRRKREKERARETDYNRERERERDGRRECEMAWVAK